MRKIKISNRLKNFPPYLFAEIDRKKFQLKEKGVKFVDLSIGDPDILAPQAVVDALYSSARIKANQKYALDQGSPSLRQSIKGWFAGRFGVCLDQNKEIVPLIGSKEGLVHLPLAFVNRGEYVICPSPGYPGYRSAARFVEAKIHELPLLEKNNFLPDLAKIPLTVRNKAKLIYVNYPNNPTSVLAPKAFLKTLVDFCSKYGIILAYDNAYSEMYFDSKPKSILEISAAKEIAVEFHSFSKTFCMTGFRIGWAAGNQDLLAGLLKVKTNIDSGIFTAIQDSAKIALDTQGKYADDLRKAFKERRDVFVKNLDKAGIKKYYAQATFYVWAKIPAGFESSLDYCDYLLTKKNIVATPGVGFGSFGRGFVRFALTVDKNILEKVRL
ncbi:MAG: aminotransferase class I/II-fold pyridoxal phosphate-dependent enzyme [Candidatus Omnitrophica bacterium]|nr:aminotransferase class I/II-fold pyridoxal phosphate-dependent enzyme [Candidatus Omnitrophota bacterium]MBU2044881.1 aminotransferase class I/II-fold pyridoxal phosphate-dependent enzyme [Candidatus Omnitrophota bacterium]MBU2250766.1 aminotransferase class I/II-fold pyridoxal phosphate-dependent enzyme [Candidatus Omnitrophota bacterium]MBU2266064.1 aminotransferase class I/II-fold pyridoxal phosphate-dependent enzyme [Candidatus Omnitrophota bacterium]MBU2473339.1 aminotransferase class I